MEFDLGADFYYDRPEKHFLEIGCEGQKPDPQIGLIRVTIEGQHAEASALLRLIQAVVEETKTTK